MGKGARGSPGGGLRRAQAGGRRGLCLEGARGGGTRLRGWAESDDAFLELGRERGREPPTRARPEARGSERAAGGPRQSGAAWGVAGMS